MKLSEWAAANGLGRQSATRSFHAWMLPVPARQLATGTILAIYARVSSADQRGDQDRQVARLVTNLTTNGLAPPKVVSEVGPGLNGHGAAPRDATVATIVVKHRDRRARFGVEYLEAVLTAQGRHLVVVDDVEADASFCARLDGRRSAKRRAGLALGAAGKAAA